MARYFCRICDSNNGWEYPSGVARETNRSHYGNFGFAYEEWNFNSALQTNGFQLGWLEGFRDGLGRRIVPHGSHDIALYVRRNGNNYFVGRINGCEKINKLGQFPYPATFAADANAVGANVQVVRNGWYVQPIINNPGMQAHTHFPESNMRFRNEDVALCSNPVVIPIAYTRYGALLAHGNTNLMALWNSLP